MDGREIAYTDVQQHFPSNANAPPFLLSRQQSQYVPGSSPAAPTSPQLLYSQTMPSFSSPELPDLPENDSGPWTCPRCSQYNHESSMNCSTCRYVHVGNSQLPVAVPVQRAAPQEDGFVRPGLVWKCEGCSYEYNLKEVTACQMCQRPKLQPAQTIPSYQPQGGYSQQAGGYSSQTVHAASVQGSSGGYDGQTGRPVSMTGQAVSGGFSGSSSPRGASYPASDMVWTCPNQVCKYEYNQKTFALCYKCSTPNPHKPPTSQSQARSSVSLPVSAPNPQHSASRGNTYPPSDALGSSAISITVQLQMCEKGWICSGCSAINPLVTNRCDNCEKFNAVANELKKYLRS